MPSDTEEKLRISGSACRNRRGTISSYVRTTGMGCRMMRRKRSLSGGMEKIPDSGWPFHRRSLASPTLTFMRPTNRGKEHGLRWEYRKGAGGNSGNDPHVHGYEHRSYEPWRGIPSDKQLKMIPVHTNEKIEDDFSFLKNTALTLSADDATIIPGHRYPGLPV